MRGQFWGKVFQICLSHSGVGSIPNGIRLHFLNLQIETGDFFEEIEVRLEGAEVVK